MKDELKVEIKGKEFGKKLLEYEKSKSPIKRAISKSIINLAKVTGFGDKERKKKEKEKELQIHLLHKMLNQKRDALENIGVNSIKLRMLIVDELIVNPHLDIKELEKAIDELIQTLRKEKKIIQESKYFQIVKKLINYANGQHSIELVSPKEFKSIDSLLGGSKKKYIRRRR